MSARPTTSLAVVALFFAILSISGCSSAPTSQSGSTSADTAAGKPGKIKAYSKVITKEAVSDSGMFITHRIDEKLYFEIPKTMLGKELLLVSRISKTPQVGYGGEESNTSIVRWERKYDKILLRTVSYENVAADSLPIHRAVEAANFEEIIEAFPIAAYSADTSAIVIDVTAFFTSDVGILTPDENVRKQYKISRLDKDRSYIDYAHSFPTNLEIENVITFAASASPQNRSSQTMTFGMHHSMVQLPEKPMMPRLDDARVGFFALRQIDYGRPEPEAVTRTYILRWRLEPSDTAAFMRGELVDPIKPITYYIDPATPVQWRSWLRKGIESWNPAFEEAGFKNAVRVLDAPTKEEDSTWSPEDARYSVIRYFPSPIENAYGPQIHDPRTGEILESDIGWFHNVLKLQTGWYFAQAVSDPRSHRLPYSDSLMGALIATVAAHEFGHTIGFPHNMGASSAYPVDSLRSKTFCEKYGTAPSIMDYARYNYIAQPGDDVDVFPKVGPYDHWAVRWGYRPILSASRTDEETDTLNHWATLAEADPYKRFGGQQWLIYDPTSQTEDLGDDPVKAGSYGIANLKRAVGYVVEATRQVGKDFTLLDEQYNDLWYQYAREIGHVANVPGGIIVNSKVFGSSNEQQFSPVSRDRQKEAVAFLGRELITTPVWLLDSTITSRLNPTSFIERLADYQARFVRTATSSDKLVRMMALEATGKAPYRASELLDDVEAMVFSELTTKRPVDYFHRNLQRDFVQSLIAKADKVDFTGIPEIIRHAFADTYKTDVRALARAHLAALEKKMQGAGADALSKAHFSDLQLQINRALSTNR